MAHMTDEDIAAAVQRGDTFWFAVLVERYEPKITRYAARFLAGFDPDRLQDVVQDVFTKAFMNMKDFDASRAFSPWIYRIAHNECVNVLKKRGRDKLTFFDLDILFAYPEYEVEQNDAMSELERATLKKMLDTSLEKIDPKYREALVLFYYEELDYKAIADILRIPISTVGVRLRRGRALLRTIVENNI